MPATQIDPADDPRKAQAEQAGPEQTEEALQEYGPELSAEAILAADDCPMERVYAPKWGGHVWIITMDGRARDEHDRYMSAHIDPKTDEFVDCDWRASILARCLANSKGELLFTEKQIVALGKKSGDTLDRLWIVARRLNRMDEKDIEEIKKASAAAPYGSSQPGSAETSEDGGHPANASES